MTKIVIDTYTFTAAAGTIDIPSVSGLQLDGFQLITNLADNVIIYQFNDSARGGTLSGTTLTLTFDTSGMGDSDALQIIYDAPTNSTAAYTDGQIADFSVDQANLTAYNNSGTYQIVSTSNPFPTQIFGENDGSGRPPLKMYAAGNQVTTPASPINMFSWRDTGSGSNYAEAATVANLSGGTIFAQHMAVVDASGNQITSFGGGVQYAEGDSPSPATGTAILGRYADGALYTPSLGIPSSNIDASSTKGLLTCSVPYINDGTGNLYAVSDTLPLPVKDSGTAIPASGATSAVTVQIVDGDGDQITSFGGGAQYTAGDSFSTATGGAVMWPNGSTWAVTDPSSPFPQQPMLWNGMAYSKQSGFFTMSTIAAAVGIVDDAGSLTGTSTNPLYVTGGGGGVQYTQGDILSGAATGTVMVGDNEAGTISDVKVYGEGSPIGTPNSFAIMFRETMADGAYVPSVANLGSTTAQHVAIVDDTGTQINSFGGGTEYTQGDLIGTGVGGLVMGADIDNYAQPAHVVGAGMGINYLGSVLMDTDNNPVIFPVYTEGDDRGGSSLGMLVMGLDTDNIAIPLPLSALGGTGNHAVSTLPSDLAGQTMQIATSTPGAGDNGIIVRSIMYGMFSGSPVPIAVNSSGELIIAA